MARAESSGKDIEAADGVVLSDEVRRRRRMRSIALALTLGGLVVLFYVLTIVKLGPRVFDRAI